MSIGNAKITGSFEPLKGDDLIGVNEQKRRDGRLTIEEAILRLQAETGKHFALHKAVYAGAIKSYAPGDDKDPIVCEPHQRDLREEIYWDDVIKWIAIEFPRFKYLVTPIPAAPLVTAGAPGGVEPVKAGPAKPLQRTAAQDLAILCEIEKLGYHPLALPKNPSGKSGVKAVIRAALSKNLLFTGTTVFNKAWERLTAREDIAIQG
jgi:hypothetical protein